jgi:hypothetical protein
MDETNSSDLFLDITLPDLRIEITLSLGDSTFVLVRRWPFQKLVLSAFIAHATAASNICLESCVHALDDEATEEFDCGYIPEV